MVYFIFDNKHRVFLGTHKIQRVSKTEKQGRRHSSSVFVYEVFEHDNSVNLNYKDVRLETFRGSGAGGQHRNKTDSCIRLTHTQTGVSVVATEQRSQHQNKSVAWRRLAEKLSEPDSQESVLIEQKWLWCEWRDQVILPSGNKKSIAAVYRKGIK